MNNLLKKSYRCHISFLVGIALIFLFPSEMYAANIFFESDSDQKETVWFEKKVRSEERSFWERSEADISEKKSISFFEGLISEEDDEFKLYAPPPGEDGNPQKIAPLGSSGTILFLLLCCFWFVYRKRKMLFVFSH